MLEVHSKNKLCCQHSKDHAQSIIVAERITNTESSKLMENQHFIKDGIKYVLSPSNKARRACEADECWKYSVDDKLCRQHFKDHSQSIVVAERIINTGTIESIKLMESLNIKDNVWITDKVFAYRGFKYTPSGYLRKCCVKEECENIAKINLLCYSHLPKIQPNDSSIEIVMSNGKKYRATSYGVNYLACQIDGCTNYARRCEDPVPVCVRHGASIPRCNVHNCRRIAVSKNVNKCFSHSPEEYKEKRRTYFRYKYATDINFRLSSQIRSRINIALDRGFKSVHSMELLGCSIEQFKEHLEKTIYFWNDLGK